MCIKKMPDSDHDAVNRTLEDQEMRKNNSLPICEDIHDSLLQKILEKYKPVFDYLEKR